MTGFIKGKAGRVKWQSPSNIALIKYWGKKGFQLPANVSLSMTLYLAFTETEVHYSPSGNQDELSIDFYFEGSANPQFKKKLLVFFENVYPELPFLKDYHFEIHSHNTFPHSAGIASSASAMSALALCLCSIEQQLSDKPQVSEENFYRKASHLARIGSGSASRSIYGGYTSWGETPLIGNSSDEYATKLNTTIHRAFHDMRDTILIISKGEKKVSSRAGHQLMEGNPFAAARYVQAEQNLGRIMRALQSGNMDEFVAVVENEAMTLHAMMMASQPGYLLIETGTLQAIRKIVEYRQSTGVPICFTLDAGPNVHLIYPGSAHDEVKSFINRELLKFCENNQFIDDHLGSGPKQIN